MTWLNKAQEAEQRRNQAANLLAVVGAGAGDYDTSEEGNDEDQEEFVYDMQVSRKRGGCAAVVTSVGLTVPDGAHVAFYAVDHKGKVGRAILLNTCAEQRFRMDSQRLQAVEELAMGDDGWRYQPASGDTTGEIGENGADHTAKTTANPRDSSREGDAEHGVGEARVAELRGFIATLARREDRF